MCHSRNSKRYDENLVRIPVEDAVGTCLAHDITEIRAGEFKGPSFRRGHKIRSEDLCHIMRLGKRHLYVLNLDQNQVHEDDAVVELAGALAGPGVNFDGQPKEGKLQLQAAHAGLLKVKVEPLVEFNLVPEVMSVDPDDVTRLGIREAGVDKIYYGAAALPGAMCLLAYKEDLPIIGLPACGLYHSTTVFDILLPRLLAGETPDQRDLARLSVGGLCWDCEVCRYPACAFGKALS
jgi:hypothetical protein